MRLFFSGGGNPWTAEHCLGECSVMLSFYVHTNRKEPEARFRRLLRAKGAKVKQRRKARK